MRRACSPGRGGVHMGLAYLRGMGVPAHPLLALDLITRACDGGSPFACANLGTLYERGEGVSRDVARAAALYRGACDAGEGPACDALGVLTMAGLDEACMRGAESTACFVLGDAY